MPWQHVPSPADLCRDRTGGNGPGRHRDQREPQGGRRAQLLHAGGRDIIHCSSIIPAAVALVTLREECVYPPTGQREPMVFLFDSEEGFLPCNCGITKPGNFVIESWDTTLTGLLTGKTTAELAGSTTCACNRIRSKAAHGLTSTWNSRS